MKKNRARAAQRPPTPLPRFGTDMTEAERQAALLVGIELSKVLRGDKVEPTTTLLMATQVCLGSALALVYLGTEVLAALSDKAVAELNQGGAA